jgi:sarcosine oxidase subunit delta
MLLIHCPYCDESRPEVEFTYAGQAHIARPADPSVLDDAQWETYLYIRDNRRGVQAERWRHLYGCARFFNALRHTVTDKFLATYKAGEQPPEITAPAETVR